MSLRPCRECGQQISSDAKVCPHCGKKRKLGISVGAVLGILVLLLIIGAALQGNKDTTTRQTAPPFPPDVLVHIERVYKTGTDFAQACARHQNLGRIHLTLLAFRNSTISATKVIDRTKFPPIYQEPASEFRKGLVEVRDGVNRTLQYWRTGDLSAIPEGENRVQAGLVIINAEINRINNSR